LHKRLLSDVRVRYVFIMAGMAGGYGLLFCLDKISFHPRTFCIFRNLTGYPCPGCGMSRAVMCLWHGNITRALWYNPLSVFLIAATVISMGWMIRDMVLRRETFIPFLKKEIHPFWKILIFLVIGLTWLWNLIKE